MRKQMLRSRKLRFGSVAMILTVLVIAVTILANAVFATLAKRYLWYSDLRATTAYGVSEEFYAYVGSLFEKQPDKQVEIIFCNKAEKLSENVNQLYVYETACELAERYPDSVTVSCHDIYSNPDSVRKYAETVDFKTGESVQTAIQSTSVILVSEGYHRVYELRSFYAFEDSGEGDVWAYNIEKRFAAGLLHATNPDAPIVCLTSNHGESFVDYELLYLLDDAGYVLDYLDLYQDPIPEKCNLIISNNPKTDLISDDTSSKSEHDILDAFLATAGNAFLVFLDNSTPNLPSFEAYLAEWGAELQYHTDASGQRYRYMIKDDAQSLTSDGYTIYGQAEGRGQSAEMLSGLNHRTVFTNATGMYAANGFVSNGDGSYTKGNRTLYSLYESSASAQAWANGSAVSEGGVMLMTLTKQTTEQGVSSVGVVTSVNFCAEQFLQSAVYGNTDVLMRMLGEFGREQLPEGLTLKPITSRQISSITTAQMLAWTIALAATPAVVITVVGIVVLVKRRYA